MPLPLHVLLLEHDPSAAELILHALRESGFEPTARRVDSEADYVAALDLPPTLILANYTLPDFDAPRALKLLQERGLDVLFIVVSGPIGEERAVAAMRSGAQDFVPKEQLHQLGQSVANALQGREQREARRIAADLLAARESRFRALIENSADAVVVVSAEGIVRYASPASARMLGGAAEAWLGANWFEHVHADDRPLVSQRFDELIQQPDALITAEFRYQHADGSWRWLEATAANRLADANVQGIVANFRDISERKQANEALRQAEERFRRYFDLGLIGIGITSPDKGMVEVNGKLCEILGYKRSELLQKAWPEITHPDDLAGEVAIFNQLLAGTSDAYSMDKRFIRKDGRTIAATISVRAVRKADGTIDYVMALLQDISERKQAEESLRHRLAELEALHSVSATLRVVQTYGEALPILLDTMLKVLETDSGAISLYDAERGALRGSVARGWFGPLGEGPIMPGEGIAGMVFASGQTYRVSEFRSDPLTRAAAREHVPPGWGGVCVPLRYGSQMVGVLFVSVPHPRHITSEQLKLLESVAEMGGAALHRMSLHEETTRQLEHLQALHSFDLTITSSMDLQVMLRTLLDHVKTQLNADAADVLLLNPSMHMLTYAAGIGFHTRVARSVNIRVGESFAGRAALERHAVQVHDSAQAQANPHFATLWADEQFAAYYGVPLVTKGEVKGVLEVFHRAAFQPDQSWIDFLETLAGQAAIAIDNSQLFEGSQRSNVDLALAYDATIEGWSHALDLRDRETEGHTQRVTRLTVRLGRAMGLSEAELVHVRRGALLHDIGKMGVPDSILLKPGPLTAEEWAVMRKHPILAYEMLSPVAYLRLALDIPYCHHEKWDGTGYPRGLKGEQIPLAARLFAVNDVWDALRSDRPYRPAWPEAKVRAHIQALSGTHFDPRALEAFWQVMAAEA